MQKTLIIVLLVAVVALSGVIVYQKLTPTEVAPIIVNQPVVNKPVVNQPVVNQPVNNQPSTNCVKEGEQGDRGCGDPSCEQKCCSGLVEITTARYIPSVGGNGCELGSGEATSKFVCSYCGNGVCGIGENQCNCPVDCTSNASKLTLSVLSNTEYYSDSVPSGQRIKLVNGTYQAKPPIEDITKLETNSITYGDLNNDGQEDAVVVLATSGGGTGFFRELEAVLNQNGKAFNVALQDLGDRTTVNSITITSGIITVDMTPWAGGTGVRKVVKYKLSGDKLIEVN